MKKLILILVLGIITISSLYSQKESYNWFFGYGCGITFNTQDKEPILLETSKNSSWEGCATISDKDGKLIFYTDGRTVWNKNHQVMLNGNNLLGHNSATQSTIIVPNPGNNEQYYIFTVDAIESNRNGFNYSIVDIKGNSGNSEVITKNIKVHPKPVERIMAIPHKNRTDYWIIVHLWEKNEFLAYLLTKNGVSNTPVISSGTVFSPKPTGSVIKASSDGSRIASAQSHAQVIELFNFDNNSGKLTLTHNLQHPYFTWPYGVEFSADNSKLYASLFIPCRLIQLDLKTNPNSILNSMVILGENPNTFYFGSLQMAPNGKIYVAQDGSNYLGVINNPNSDGLSCNFKERDFFLKSAKSGLGLPSFLQSYFLDTTIVCNAKGNEEWLNGNFNQIDYNFQTGLEILNQESIDEFLTKPSCIISNINPLKNSENCDLFDGSDNQIHFHTKKGNNLIIKSSHKVKSNCEYAFGFDFTSLKDYVYTELEVLIDQNVVSKDFFIDAKYCNQSKLQYQYISNSDKDIEIEIRLNNSSTECFFSIDNLSFKKCECPEMIFENQNRIVCSGGKVALIGEENPSFSNSWEPRSLFVGKDPVKPIINPTETTRIFHYLTNLENGCVYIDTIDIQVADIIDTPIKGSSYICEGDSTVLSVDSNFITVKWSTNETTETISIKLPGTYEVTAIDSNGCLYKGKIDVYWAKKPIISIEGPKEVCKFEKFTLIANSNNADSIQWFDGQSITNPMFIGPGVYKVKAIGKGNCFSEAEIEIKEKPSGQIKIIGNRYFCLNSNNHLSLEGDYVNVEWSTGSNEKAIDIDVPGEYSVTAIDSNGCLSVGSITINQFLPITFEPIDLGKICVGNDILYSFSIKNISDSSIILDFYIDEENSAVALKYISVNQLRVEPNTETEVNFLFNVRKNSPDNYLTIKVSEPCSMDYEVPIIFDLNESSAKVWIKDTMVSAGDYICIPIYASIDCIGQSSAFVKYQMELQLNKKVFSPEKIVSGMFVVMDNSGDNTKIHIFDSTIVYDEETIINYLCGRVLLSDSITNLIDIKQVNWNDLDIKTQIQNGNIILSQCQFGIRHFDLIKVTDMKVIPNVSDDNCNIFIETSEVGHFKIELIDLNGNLVKEINFQRHSRQEQEEYSFKINLGSINSGFYIIRLVTPWSIKTNKLLIVH